MKCSFRSYFNWLILFVYLIQLSFIFICCMKPSEIFDTGQDSTFWDYFESMWLYPPWIFGSSTLMIDSIFFFCVNIVPFFIICYSSIHIKKFNHQMHVNFWCSLVIRLFQQILTPIMSIPMTFRLSYLIEQIFIQKITDNWEMIFSFIIAIINIILHIVHTYFASIFLIPIDFVIHSKADFYDGKYMMLIHSIRIVIAISCFMFSYITNLVAVLIIFGFVFIICFLALFLRLSIQVHVSPIGQYLEILPFFACPYMILFRYFIQNNVYSLLLLILLYIFFAFLFQIQTHFMIKQSLKAFSPFMKQSKYDDSVLNNDDFNPSLFTGSVISIIRIVAVECSDPDSLLRFLNYQKKSSELKNSYIIEVVRFLALFPSRRKECLKQLEHFRSKSNINLFTAFMFKKILKSLDGIESTEKNLVCLNNFYRSFLVHKHLFWVARKNKKYFIASREALSTAYFFIEVKNEFHYLMKRYTFDSFLHYYYADFHLSACGDFESYLIECQIAQMLDNIYSQSSNDNNNNHNSFNFNKNIKNYNSIVDPLLHPMSINNPKILQFCSSEETKINIHFKNQKQYDLLSNNTINSSSSSNNNSPKYVATFLNEKKFLIPFLSIFHIFVPIGLFLFVIGGLYIKDQQIHFQSIELYKKSVDLLNSFYIASSMVYIPYLTHIYTSENFEADNTTFFYKKYNKIKFKNFHINDSFNNNNYYTDYNYYYDKNLVSNDNLFFDENEKLIETFFDLPFYAIDFFSQIQPLGNLTGGMIFIFEQYISNNILKNFTIQQVLNTTAIEMDYFSKAIFHEVYIKVEEIKKNAIALREIYKDDLDGFYICKVSIVTICVFSVVSTVVYIFQINYIYKNDHIKIDFLSSIQLFSSFLFQESKKAWELLRQYEEDTISDDISDLSISSYSSNMNLQNLTHSYQLENQDSTSSRPNETSSSKEPELIEMTVNGHNFNNDVRSLLNSNNYIQIKDSNNKTRRNDDDDSIYEATTSCYVSSSQEDSSNIESDNQEENVNNVERDICSQAIETSKATEKEGFLFHPFFHIVILLFAPLVFTVVIIAVFQIPLIQRAHAQEKRFQNILIGESFANHSLIILNGTFDILEKRSGIRLGFEHDRNQTDTTEPNSTYFETYINEILSDLKWLSQFYDEKCYELIDVVCMSVETALYTAINRSTHPAVIASRCIPFIYLFTWNLFNDLFFSGMNELYLMKLSNGTSFIIATVLLMLTFVHLSFSSAILLKKAFNSIFHFPDDFLKQPIEKPKDTSKSWKDKLPQNALIVTSITKSDEIYSVSDNSKEIINCNLNDLISLKMTNIFKKVPENVFGDDKLCEFSITDKKKKIFRYSTETIGCLTKTVLIEENSCVDENTGQQSYTQKLHSFIPPHFAEMYGKNDQNEFNFVKCYIICVRISDSISPQMVEKCFNAANHISQNSVSINILCVDGEMITFSSTSNCKLIVILLLIRDFIDTVLKSTKNDKCIYSIYVQYVENLLLSVVDDEDEPYLNLQPFDLNYCKIRLFQIGNDKIAFAETADENSSLISKVTEKENINVGFDGNHESIFVLPINQLVSKIVVFV